MKHSDRSRALSLSLEVKSKTPKHYLNGFGPAARIFAGASNFSKFLAKRAARSAADLSYAALSFHESRGRSNSAGTPGTDFGMVSPNAGSVSNSTLASAPSIAAFTIARVY